MTTLNMGFAKPVFAEFAPFPIFPRSALRRLVLQNLV
jgi:hypothetical protein